MKNKRTITVSVPFNTNLLLDGDLKLETLLAELINEQLKKELDCCAVEKVKRDIIPNEEVTITLTLPTVIADVNN